MASRSWNRVELIGNVTKDPELRYTPSGAAVVTFSIATNRTFVSDGEKRKETDFHRVVAWNKLAELCSQLIKKGNRVFVSGRLQNRSWEQDGQTKYMTETVIEDMILLTSKFGGQEYQADENGSVASGVPSRSVEEMPSQIKSDEQSSSAAQSKSENKQSLPSDEGGKTGKSKESDETDSNKATADKSEEPEDAEEPKKKNEKTAAEDVTDLDDLPF